MIRPVGQGLHPIELAMRGAQPALRDGGVRVIRALECHLSPLWIKETHDDEEVSVNRGRRDEEPRDSWARDLGRLRERSQGKGDAIAERVVLIFLLGFEPGRAERPAVEIEAD